MVINNTAPLGEPEAIPPIVLLIEDDRDTLDMYSAYFQLSGMWVATSTRPDEAIDAVEELKPDVIVTDLVFAGQPRGIDFAQALKSRAETCQIPLIMLSGRSVDDLPSVARQAADLYLEKPVLPDRLFAKVRGLLSRSRALHPRAETALETARREVDRAAEVVRTCPDCGDPLDWVERGRIGGADYDYYQWCQNGCGLYCYDPAGGKWVKLA